MAGGFSWDAKRGSTPHPFVTRVRESDTGNAAAVPETLRELYTQLTRWKPLLEQGPV